MAKPKTLHFPVDLPATPVREPEFNFGRTDIERLFVEVPEAIQMPQWQGAERYSA